MKINIKATGMELPPEILAYAEKRLQKMGKLVDASDPIMAVELGRITNHHKQGNVFRAEVRITGGGVDYYAAREADDIRTAIDLVENEMITEITKDKGKRETLMRRGGRKFKDMVRGFSDWRSQMKNPFKQ